MNGHRTGRSHAAVRGQGGNGLGRQATKRSVSPGKDRMPDVERRSAVPPCSDDDCEELGGTQRVRAEVLEPLTRPFGPGKLPNT
jgi:hypothetical protein